MQNKSNRNKRKANGKEREIATKYRESKRKQAT